MIDANWTIGHTEPLAVFIYRLSYLIASYKLQIVLTFQTTVKWFLISYSFSCVSSWLTPISVLFYNYFF